MKFKKIFFFTIFFFILVVFFFALKKPNIYNTKNLIGQKIEPFEIISFENNEIVTEKNLQENNFTLINFWASWCSPCRVEHPFLISLSKTKKVKLIGVNFKDKKRNAQNFLNTLGNPYDLIVTDNNGTYSIHFGIYGIPESILIDKELKILAKFIGPIDKDDYKKIFEIIKNDKKYKLIIFNFAFLKLKCILRKCF